MEHENFSCNSIKYKDSIIKNKYYDCTFCSLIYNLDKFIICTNCLTCHMHLKEEIINFKTRAIRFGFDGKLNLPSGSILINNNSLKQPEKNKKQEKQDIQDEHIIEAENYIKELNDIEFNEDNLKNCFCYLNLHRSQNPNKNRNHDELSNVNIFGTKCNLNGRMKFKNGESGKKHKFCDFCYEFCGLKKLNYEISIEMGTHRSMIDNECNCNSKHHNSIKNFNSFCYMNQADNSFFCENIFYLIEDFNEKFTNQLNKDESVNLISIFKSFMNSIEKNNYTIYSSLLKMINLFKGIKNVFILRNEDIKIFSLIDSGLVIGTYDKKSYEEFILNLVKDINLNRKINFEREINFINRTRNKFNFEKNTSHDNDVLIKKFHFFSHVFLFFLLSTKIKLKIFTRNYFIMSSGNFEEVKKLVNRESTFFNLLSVDDSEFYYDTNKLCKIFKRFIKITRNTLKNYTLDFIASILSFLYKGNFNHEDINSLICLNYSIYCIFKIIKHFLKYFNHILNKKLLISILDCLDIVFRGFSMIIKNSKVLDLFFKTNLSNVLYRTVFTSIKVFKIFLEISQQNQILDQPEIDKIYSLFFTGVEKVNTFYANENFSIRDINIYIDQIIFRYFNMKENPSYNICVKKDVSKYLFAFIYLDIILDPKNQLKNLSMKIDSIVKDLYKDIDILSDLKDECLIVNHIKLERILKKKSNELKDFFKKPEIKSKCTILIYHFVYLIEYSSHLKQNNYSYVPNSSITLPDNFLSLLIPIIWFDNEIFDVFISHKFFKLLNEYMKMVMNISDIVFFLTFFLKKLKETSYDQIQEPNNNIDVKNYIDSIISIFHEIMTKVIENSIMDKNLYLFVNIIEELNYFDFDNNGYKLIVYNLFMNYFISFFGPSIRHNLINFSYMFEKELKCSGGVNLLKSEEFSFWIKIVNLISNFYLNINCDNDYYISGDTFSWINLLLMNYIDFDKIFNEYGVENFTESITFAEQIIDFYLSIFSNTIKFNNYVYKDLIDKNTTNDPEDDFLKMYWDIYDQFGNNLMLIKLSNFLFDLDYFFGKNVDHFFKLKEIYRKKFVFKYFNLLKILLKYFRYFIFNKNKNNYANLVNDVSHPIELKLNDYLKKLNSSTKNESINKDILKHRKVNSYININNKICLIDLLILQFLSTFDELFVNKQLDEFANIEHYFQIDSLQKNFFNIDFYVKMNINIDILTSITMKYQSITYINNKNSLKRSSSYNELLCTSDQLSSKLTNKENCFKLEIYHIVMRYIYNVESIHIFRNTKNEKFKFISKSLDSPSVSNYISQLNLEKLNYLSFLNFEGEFLDNLYIFNYNLWNHVNFLSFSNFLNLLFDEFYGHILFENIPLNELKQFKNFSASEQIYKESLRMLQSDHFNSDLSITFKYQPNNLWYKKYYNDYTNLIHYLIKYDGFQTLFNDHILNKNINLTIVFLYNMIYYSQSLFRTELFKKEYIERKKCINLLINTFEIIKNIFQDNKYKSLIDHLKLNFQFFKDSDFGIILNLIVYFSNYKIHMLFKLLLEEEVKHHLKDLNLNVVLKEHILLTKKSIDLFCEFNQGSLNFLTNNINYLIDSLKIIISDFDYDSFIDNNSILEKILEFKYQGYLLLKFACDELTTLPHFLNNALKNYDMNILKKDFVMANLAAENLIKNFLVENKISYDKQLNLFDLIKIYWQLIDEEFVYKMCRSIFVVIKYLNEVYNIQEFDDFFKLDNKNAKLSNNLKKKKKMKKKTNSINFNDFELLTKSKSINSELTDETKNFISKKQLSDENDLTLKRKNSLILTQEPEIKKKNSVVISTTNNNTAHKMSIISTSVKRNTNYKLKQNLPKSIIFVKEDPNLDKYKMNSETIDTEEAKVDIIESILMDNQAINSLVQFYNTITRHIEIFYCPEYMNIEKAKNDKQNLRKIFFEINPFFFNLSTSTKLYFLNNCNRDSQMSKLSELIENTDFFWREIDYLSENPSEMKRLLKLINFKQCEILLFFITLLINMIFLINLTIKDNELFFPLSLSYIIKFLNLIQILFCSAIIYIWHEDKHLIYYNAFIVKNNNPEDFTLLTKLRYYFYDSLIDKNEINSFLFVLILSILSIIYYNSYYLIGFQLASVINLNKYLRNVLSVLKKRFQQILQTLILLLILIYMYSLIGFFFFNEEYEDSELKENQCQELIQCYLTHISYGIRSGGGIGEHLPRHYFGRENNREYYRMIFDLMWYFFVNLLMLNVILGVIVDTFKEMRQENDSQEYDKENVCFVCGINRNQARSLGLDFYEHINKDHDIWNYAFFLINLQILQGKDMNTYELYVDNQIKNQSTSFFPEMICSAMQKNRNNSQ